MTFPDSCAVSVLGLHSCLGLSRLRKQGGHGDSTVFQPVQEPSAHLWTLPLGSPNQHPSQGCWAGARGGCLTEVLQQVLQLLHAWAHILFQPLIHSVWVEGELQGRLQLLHQGTPPAQEAEEDGP